MVTLLSSENMEKHSYSPLSQGKESDEDSVKKPSFLSHLVSSWLSPTMRLGYSRPLEEDDVPLTAVGQEDTADLTLKLQTALNAEPPTEDKERSKKLWRSLLRVISPLDYATFICTMLGDSICRFVQPVLMRLLLWNLSNNPGVNGWSFGLAIGISSTLFLQPFFKSHCEYVANVIAAKMRSSLRGIVYQKVQLIFKKISKNIVYFSKQ